MLEMNKETRAYLDAVKAQADIVIAHANHLCGFEIVRGAHSAVNAARVAMYYAIDQQNAA